MTVGDFSSDGRLDLVTADAGSNTTGVFLANGTTSPFLPVLNLNHQADALTVLTQMTTALNRITSELGSMGASESRFQIAVANLSQRRENVDTAASRIMDVDVAEESANLTEDRILQQAGAAILAQGSQQPTLALQLLKEVR